MISLMGLQNTGRRGIVDLFPVGLISILPIGAGQLKSRFCKLLVKILGSYEVAHLDHLIFAILCRFVVGS